MSGELVLVSREELATLVETAVRRALEANQGGPQVEWLDVASAAKLLQCHPRTLARKAKRGELPAARLGRSWRFRKVDLNAFLEGGGA